MKKIKGPLAPLATGSTIYQVTLASGMIITNPAAFGEIERAPNYISAVVSEDGRVLVAPKTETEPFPHF